ncbi:hypothetical protein BJV78DRAFT_690554 [Lactifluus subvellereus]|nr:hypothetical protein BJV78DRAFT_690554 [Lactifluus subvellereus]
MYSSLLAQNHRPHLPRIHTIFTLLPSIHLSCLSLPLTRASHVPQLLPSQFAAHLLQPVALSNSLRLTLSPRLLHLRIPVRAPVVPREVFSARFPASESVLRPRAPALPTQTMLPMTRVSLSLGISSTIYT